ncbi:MAG: hypothetical protein Q7W55_09665 [Pseudohongiella sp.]|nr:hypothetical protein [Pseudohongiella sp.]
MTDMYFQSFANSAASAAARMVSNLSVETQRRVEEKMAGGCKLSISLITGASPADVEIVLFLVDAAGTHHRVAAVPAKNAAVN